MSEIDTVCGGMKGLESEKEQLEALKEAGSILVGGIEIPISEDKITEMTERIGAIETDLDKMITASNTNIKTTAKTFVELKEVVKLE